MKKHSRFYASAMGLLLMSVVAASQASNDALLKMSDQLDQLDKDEFSTAIEQADTCIQQRKFDCSRQAIALARKNIVSETDKQMLAKVTANLADEIEQVEREEEEAELAYRQEVLRERRERQAQKEQEDRARIQGTLAVMGAAAIGSNTGLTAEQRTRLTDSWVKDRANAANGYVSDNFSQTKDQMIDESRVKRQLQPKQDSQLIAKVTTIKNCPEGKEWSYNKQDCVDTYKQNPSAAQNTISSTDNTKKILPLNVEQPALKIEGGRTSCPPGYVPKRHPNGGPMTIPESAYCVAGDDSARNPQLDNGSTVATNTDPSAPTQVGHMSSSSAGNKSGSDLTTAAKSSATETAKSQTSAFAQSSSPKKTGVVWGEVQMEAYAICRKSEKTNKWWCDGPGQNLLLADEESVEKALGMVDCDASVARQVQFAKTNNGNMASVYGCGFGLRSYDRNIIKIHNITASPRSFMCPKNYGKKCMTLYTGQDKAQ